MKVQAFPILIENIKYIGLHIAYNREAVEKIKTIIHGAWWQPTQRCWVLPYCKANFDKLATIFQSITYLQSPPPIAPDDNYNNSASAKIVEKPVLSEVHQDAFLHLEQQLRLLRYSLHTVKNYKNCFLQFLHFHHDTPPEKIIDEQIRAFLLHKIQQENISESAQNQLINAIKFYYEFCLDRNAKYLKTFARECPKNYPM